MKVSDYIFSLIHKYYSFIKDVFVNLFGNLLITIIVQLVAFPLLSRFFSRGAFGSITSLYGINSVIIVMTGDALANVRLINNNKNGINFNMLALIDSMAFSLFISLILFFIYGKFLSFIDIVLFAVTTSIMSFLEYIISLYRIKLRYNYYLVQNILVSVGYIIGIGLFLIFHYWSLIFLTGNVLAVIYSIIKSGILKERFVINFQFKSIFHSLINISIGDTLSSVMYNLDRFIIPIILGVVYLPAFFSSNTLSKMFGLIMGPFSSVLLSHLSKLQIKWTKKKVNHLFYILTGVALCIIIPSYLFSYAVMRLLYNNIYLGYNHMDLIIILSCIATCFLEVWHILNTIYFICLKSRFQVIINCIFIISYLVFSVLFSFHFKLVGYTLGYMLAVIFSYCISFILTNVNELWKDE